MPRRRRVDKRRRLGAREVAALRGGSGAEIEHAFGSLSAARDAWSRVRAELLAQCEPGQRPSAYWLFEAPARLRPLPPGPSGPGVLTALTDDMTRAHDALAVWREERERMRRARVAWLDENDLLTAREREHLHENTQQKGSHDRR